MNKFRRGSDRGGNRGFGNQGGRQSQRIDHKTKCDECHQACTVPFRPTGNKPVLCRDCFKGNDSGGRGSRDRDRGRSFDRKPSGPDVKKELDQINKKLDNLIELINDLFEAADEELENSPDWEEEEVIEGVGEEGEIE